MNGREVAEALLKDYATCEVVLKVGDAYVEVFGVGPTGLHRNAVELKPVVDAGVPGVVEYGE